MTYWLGVDLGGTKMMASIFDDTYQAITTVKKNTKGFLGTESTLQRLIKVIQLAISDAGLDISQISGIGIGVPGPVDYTSGTVQIAPNLGWNQIPLTSILSPIFPVPIWVENDVNAGTFAAYQLGDFHDKKNIIGVFIGTGIGGGIIIDGELVRGRNGLAGEIGHMVISPNGPRCGCGQRGCFEAMASKSALMTQIHQEAIKKGPAFLKKYLKKNGQLMIKSSDIKANLELKDHFITKNVQRMGKMIGIGLANLTHLLNPDAIILGGGVIDSLYSHLSDRIQKTYQVHVMPSARHTPIAPAQIGDMAVSIGAVMVAKTRG